MKTTIIIPARWASKRFPGKPLAQLCGQPLLEHVWKIAAAVCEKHQDCRAIVATENGNSPSGDSTPILEFCHAHDIPVIETPDTCRSGSDRVWSALQQLSRRGIMTDVVLNLQGDNPFCPPHFLEKLMTAFYKFPETQVASAYVRLTWSELDAFREAKKISPFSGTSVIINKEGKALWFSKNIIPAIRNEQALRQFTENFLCRHEKDKDILSGAGIKKDSEKESEIFSPICRHIGLYAYSVAALEFFATTPAGEYEQLEQLEQLRFLENGIPIHMEEVRYPSGYYVTSGIDSPEDLHRAEKWMKGKNIFSENY
ncbi:MAG: 3-deoxy-manno-octulosonate cytidylyltransferase [Planctomycetia bacterium]|nr:3-deoxy-manno-octulosonate cytidylyltransferase [Planctomycetia bacterium]